MKKTIGYITHLSAANAAFKSEPFDSDQFAGLLKTGSNQACKWIYNLVKLGLVNKAGMDDEGMNLYRVSLDGRKRLEADKPKKKPSTLKGKKTGYQHPAPQRLIDLYDAFGASPFTKEQSIEVLGNVGPATVSNYKIAKTIKDLGDGTFQVTLKGVERIHLTRGFKAVVKKRQSQQDVVQSVIAEERPIDFDIEPKQPYEFNGLLRSVKDAWNDDKAFNCFVAGLALQDPEIVGLVEKKALKALADLIRNPA